MIGPFVILALYRFVPLADVASIRVDLLELCRREGLVGTLILAEEGINGTVAGTPEAIDRLRSWFAADPRFLGMEATECLAAELPFHRLKVLHKREIVKLGDPRAEPTRTVGTHVEPEDWNALIEDPDVTIIDTRNAFEVAVGTFAGSIDPGTTSFGEFPAFVSRHLDPARYPRIAMFCTGGVRCEKASSLLRQLDFDQVYQLHGGILRYLERVPPTESRWRGECFVFDRRVSLTAGLRIGTYHECHGCKAPVSDADRHLSSFEPDVSCPACHASLTNERREALRERRKQISLAATRGTPHLGATLESSGGAS